LDRVSERVCDTAAEKLGDLVLGLPLYHPLCKDSESRRQRMMTVLDQFRGRYRRLSGRELEALERPFWESNVFVLAMSPLRRAATAEDVRAGNAIFHLDGDGKPLGLALPAVAVLKETERNDRPATVLVVQAEINSAGAITYGILGAGEMRPVPADELTKVSPLTKPPKP
jgi:hypothetical protein